MPPLFPPERNREAPARSLWVPLVVAGACLIVWQFNWQLALAQQVVIRQGRAIDTRNHPQSADSDVVAGVYLPTDRSLSRAVVRARERLKSHEFHEVLPFLQGILSRDEDSFLERSGDDRAQLGLKAAAQQMISELPPEGRDAYELLQGPTARRQLEAALSAGDREGVAKVVRQYFHTNAGYEATFLLAQMEADQGHRLAADQLYRDLIEAPQAAARFEPQLSIAAALNQLAAGQSDAASATVRALVERNPAGSLTLFGKEVALPSNANDSLAWLVALVGEVKATTSANGNWLTLHGDASRNTQVLGGEPHLRPRWETRVINEPSIESFITNRANDFVQRGVVAIPGARPIAVGDVIVMRTPTNVVAIDWQTGKRIWETRDEQEPEAEDTAADLAPGVDRDQLAGQARPLEERMWDDALATALSSDGSRVFIVRGMPTSHGEEATPWQVNVFGRGGLGENPNLSNQLVAYDIATQGKLVWELDGSRTAGPFAGAFFLGPPLAIDNTLFVMAEIRGAISLMALDPATGHIEWQQQLVRLEQGIAADPARRRVGAIPSYSSGILVCPTSASAAIGIDVVKRQFAWVYRYPREVPTGNEARNQWQQQQAIAQGQLPRTNDQWLDNSAVIADGRVLLTPPESGEIHCLDLQTGKQLWKRRQGESLFIGGVDHGIVLLIGSQTIQAVKLADGTPAWKQESLPLPRNVLPAGQGYVSQGKYYLPLSSGQIAEIDFETGNVSNDEPANPDLTLGNLICYRGSVLSQSPLMLDKFEQLDVLQKRTEEALAHNPDDAVALRELAEIKDTAGDKREAIKLLKHALELAPNDAVCQETLAETLLQALAGDYASYRDDIPILSRLIHTRSQQIELLRITAAGDDKPDNRLAAWDAYLKLADFTAEEPAYLYVDDHYTVRSDRWIAGRLLAIWNAASPAERDQLSEQIAKRRPDLAKSYTAGELRHYLAHLGELPHADEVRLALAKFLIEHARLSEAELELLQLINSNDADTKSTAAALLKELTAKSKHSASLANVNWPRGHVDAEMISTAAADQQNRTRGTRLMPERQSGYRQMRIEQDYAPGFGDVQWFVASDCTEVVARNSLGDDVLHFPIEQAALNRTSRDSGLVHGARVGHLMFLTAGGQVMAIDARQDSPSSEGDQLWPNRSADEFTTDSARLRRAPNGTPARSSRPVVYNAKSGRRRVTGTVLNLGDSLGPATPFGVVFQDQDDLKCVDPLTGATLWERNEIPIGCELFGDSEFAFAADVANRIVYVVRVKDGELVGKRDLPRGEWLVTAGRNVAQINYTTNHGSRVIAVTITNIWDQKQVYSADLPISTQVATVEPNAIAIFEPSGAFHLIDAETGHAILDQKLDPVNDLQAIQTLRFDDELFLFVSGPVQPQFRPIGQPSDYPMTSGPVYAFDLKSGEPLWRGPAIVRNRGIIFQQPSDIPLLVFADRQMTRDAMSGGGSQLRLLCLDRRTGETA
ncbi:MAG TPA: PQQ-binding-like beta-propeller repeat protein, partial [Lacipirellulaceae bacterium]|nr:PQQ-binding-like beta-propeller repeat protein [Lacipirellulaceae bacterium]